METSPIHSSNRVQAMMIVAGRFRTTPAALGPDTRLREDLGADSLDLVVLACELEDRFGVEIPDTALDGARTIGDVLRVVRSAGPAPG